MKLIVQRVKKAKVIRVSGSVTLGQIDKGLFILVGFKKGDTEEMLSTLSEKLLKLRVMSDESNKMNLSTVDVGSDVLVVSQFTLYADTSGGNRPSFTNAEEPGKAKILYDLFVAKLKEKGIRVESGSFGDYMEIETVLDGPVTITYET